MFLVFGGTKSDMSVAICNTVITAASTSRSKPRSARGEKSENLLQEHFKVMVRFTDIAILQAWSIIAGAIVSTMSSVAAP